MPWRRRWRLRTIRDMHVDFLSWLWWTKDQGPFFYHYSIVPKTPRNTLWLLITAQNDTKSFIIGHFAFAAIPNRPQAAGAAREWIVKKWRDPENLQNLSCCQGKQMAMMIIQLDYCGNKTTNNFSLLGEIYSFFSSSFVSTSLREALWTPADAASNPWEMMRSEIHM